MYVCMYVCMDGWMYACIYDEVGNPRPPSQPSVPAEKTRMADRTDIAKLICRVLPRVIREARSSITAM